ncbi:TetR/AcrR family transcriptional regulator [Streptomyces sp. HC44]|uniref:TetR/AcrR family transcriptional regulator n=1 Tax=Streptomyces scabichelini TaxID=2711217 RepID=A0A6G4VH55_9ACTN|nr:TetR/AcrR family transcriptional regulator [Streptomyces scabichelini]NGO13429.1 TetR/AcrR family transcriptional regulator [Streptomyces scabichelini]
MDRAQQPQARERILAAAATLIAESGADAASIRDVCTAAGVTAPTVYHHFGDKRGLLDAVAADGFERYLAEKRELRPSPDPVEDLRRGWNRHVEFGIRNPALYGLMYGGARVGPHPAAKEGEQLLRRIVERIDEAKLLSLPVDEAVQTIHAATVGTTLLLITDPDAPGARGLSERSREAVLNATLITRSSGATYGLPAHAEMLLTALSQTVDTPFTFGERAIFLELLSRLTTNPHSE